MRFLRWIAGSRRRKVAALFGALLIAGFGIRFCMASPRLETTPLLALPGTVTSMSRVGDVIYFTQLNWSKGTALLSVDKNDYAEVTKISVADFLSGKGTLEKIATVQGHITAGCASHDQKRLYFIHRKPQADGSGKSFFCSLDLSTLAISEFGPFGSYGVRLADVEGKFLAEYSEIHISVKREGTAEWRELLPDIAARRSVVLHNGDVYYKLDDDVFFMPKAEILNGTFNAAKIHTLSPGLNAGQLCVGGNNRLYVMAYRKNRPAIVAVESGAEIPVSVSAGAKSTISVEPFFEYNNEFYSTFFASETFLGKYAILKSYGGKTAAESFRRAPYFLGTINEYLIFNIDMMARNDSRLFAIKYR